MFTRCRHSLLLLAGAFILATVTGCATTITFDTLQPAPIDVENFKSVALIPFTANPKVSYSFGGSDFSANILSQSIEQSMEDVKNAARTKGGKISTDGESSGFLKDLAKRFSFQFQDSLLAEELFIVLPAADVAKAAAELGDSATPLDIAKKLNVAAFYTGEVEVLITDYLTSDRGSQWQYSKTVPKKVTKTVTDAEGNKKVVEETVNESKMYYWANDARPPKDLKAEKSPNSAVFAVERTVEFKTTYKLIQTSDGKVLSSRTFSKKSPKSNPVILFDSNAEPGDVAFANSRAEDVLAVKLDSVAKLAQSSYRWITSELRPATVKVTRELMNDQSKDGDQGKELDGYIKLTTEKKYDEAEKGFLAMWTKNKNIAAAFNASMLMERRKDYVTALKVMDQLVAAQPTEDLQKKRNLLKSAASAYAKAMEQKKKIENNAVKIQRILDEKGYKVKVEVADTGIKLILDDIKFKPDSAEYEKSEETKLKNLAAIVEIFPQYDVLLIGHAANPKGVAQDDEAMVLSKKRAQAIANFFIKAKIRTTNNVFAEGRGITEPIADNTTEEGRAKNRRIEMTFVIN